MSDQYVEIKTTDGTKAWIRKGLVGAVENIPGTARTNPTTKIYVSGFSFTTEESAEEVLKRVSLK